MRERRFADSQAELDRALAADRAHYGENHSSVAADFAAQADLDAARGDSTAAILHARDALERYTKLLPPGHPKIADVRLTLATSLGASGEAAGAGREYALVIESTKAAQPVNRRVLVRALLGAAQTALALNDDAHVSADLDEAEQLLSQFADPDALRELQALRQRLGGAQSH
jgi:hypothetical protein